MKENLKKAFIIGYGRMGKRHKEALLKNSFGEIFIFDFNSSGDPNNSELIPIEHLEEYLIKIKPSLVVISTNADSHVEYLKTVVKQKINYILCEKPLCTSLNDLIELRKIIKAYPEVNIAINHQIRFMNFYREIKKIIDNKSLGDLESINVHAGNFGLAMNGIHYCELFRYLTNCPPQKCWGWLENQNAKNPRGEQYKDYAGCMRVENVNAQRLYIDCSNKQGHGIFVNYCFEYGQLFVDELSGKGYINQRKSTDLHFPCSHYGLPGEIDVIQFPLKDIIDSTAELVAALMNKQEYTTLNDAELAVRTLIAAIASSNHKNSSVDINKLPLEYQSFKYMWA